jgi:aminoglycoside 3-N-acetyltransferase
MIKSVLKKVVPDSIKQKIKSIEQERIKKEVASLPLIEENDFLHILKDELGVTLGDVVFIHSSIDRLNLNFPFYRALSLLKEAVGSSGTIIFPTYPKQTSYEFLRRGEIFDIRKTPSFTGLLNEFARKQPNSVRSLHPTKSVSAIGPLSKQITVSHQDSPYPYDFNSPYYKISEHNGKIIGLGVYTTYLSAVHCIDDTLKEKFPVNPYHKELFNAKCIDYNKNVVIVRTYAHDMRKMSFNLPAFFSKFVPQDICCDINIKGMRFFRADAKKMFEFMSGLALNDKITIYSKI